MSRFVKCRNRLALGYYRVCKSRRRFELGGQEYHYSYRLYNHTWRNERAVEIPVMHRWMQRYPASEILEVGNVLSHYFQVRHDIVDKYEQAPNVTNRDIVDFDSTKRYRLILSISTLEHIGYAENQVPGSLQQADGAKIVQALDALRRHLACGGQLVLSVPVGFNPALDAMLGKGIACREMLCMKRVSQDNRWLECSFPEVITQKYGQPFPAANGLIFLVVGDEPNI